jgi:hypothetical protein
VRALFLLSLGLLAGCGNNAAPVRYDLGACGGGGQRCCMRDTCDPNFACITGFCQQTPCGEVGERCCGDQCNMDLACVDKVCETTCGHAQQPCCAQELCYDPGTKCSPDQVCENPDRATGGPCASSNDCDGADPYCLTTDSFGVTWPSGYCTSFCDPSHSDPQTGLNADCPGGRGICNSNEAMVGGCMAGCTAMDGAIPCRAGYACFLCGAQNCSPVCEPHALSGCDPTVANSCELNNQICIRTGLDNVGSCLTGCDLFTQDCAHGQDAQACYVIDDTGRGFCQPQRNILGDGQVCATFNDCLPGLTCFIDQTGPRCRPFCGGPLNVACTNGKSCVDFSMKVKLAVVGVCAG